MKPKLYQYAACPFCSKVASMLALKKVDYDVIEVNPLNKKEIEFSENYKKVPIYIDSTGEQINDSNEIFKHLDRVYPNPAVYSEEISEQERIDKWLRWSEKLVKGLPAVIYEKLGDSFKAFDYIIQTGKFNWFQSRMIKYSGAFVMTMVAKKIKKREEIEDPKEFLRRMTAQWVEGLEGRTFMGGDQPNAADVAVFGICRAVGNLKAGPIFQENKDFWSWLEAMKSQTGLELSVV